MVSEAVVVALIAAGGSIAAAAITAITALVVERIKRRPDPPKKWNWVKRYGYPLGAAIVVLVVLLVGSWVYLGVYDGTKVRLESALPTITGLTKRIYPNVGLGLDYPQNWELEDYAFRSGGGEIELIRDRRDNHLFETQAVTLGIQNIAEHHWSNPESEFVHFEAELKNCQPPAARVKEAFAYGREIDSYKCSYVRGSDGKHVELRDYYYQMSRCIRLKIETWTELDGLDKSHFYSEVEQFLANMRLDDTKMKANEIFCISHGQAN